MNPVLECKEVSLSYHSADGETSALSHISFAVEEGEFLAIVGPSGCGKTTLLNVICGNLRPEFGEILVHGMHPTNSSQKMGYMLQKDYLLEWRNIYQNVTLGLEIKHRLTPSNRQKVQKMLVTYGLEQFQKAHPSQLSGGMRQRAALIRTLVTEPELLLLDEPFSALDYQTRLNVSDDIGRIIKQERKTAILVTHDISEAISMADRVLILSNRPATIQREVPISLELTNRTPLTSRNDPKFKQYFNLIWKELNQDGSHVPQPETVSHPSEAN